MASIGLYSGHNASVAVEHNGEYLVVELERFLNHKNIELLTYKVAYDAEEVMGRVLAYCSDFFKTKLSYENCIYNDTGSRTPQLLGLEYGARNYIPGDHHEAHAAGTFYQSPFEKALAISFDGRGNDGYFNIYLAERSNSVTRIGQIDLDLGYPYMFFGHYLKSIKKEPSLIEGNLVYPGKIMGLCSYGTPQEAWLPFVERLYRGQPLDGSPTIHGRLIHNIFHRKGSDMLARDLGTLINLPLRESVDGKAAYDLAATSQRAFENVFFESVTPFIEQYPHLPLCLSGGCALNIILNSKVKERYKREVFVAPNPNDCGLALGLLLHVQKPQAPVNAMYLGMPLFDLNELPVHRSTRSNSEATPAEVARILSRGKILGVARGRAEHGPRALGNRSILCDPAIPNIKEHLHTTIKKREKYRPFAPVVRAEDVSKYFIFEGESPYMAFLTMVRSEWREKLGGITHVDGSARVQTVTAKQNPWLYDLLGHFEVYAGHGVLLNTSFNIDGFPLLSTVKEAFQIMDTTCLDGVVVEDTLFLK